MSSLSRVLHVDDEPDIREVVKISLEAVGGFTVETCCSGDDALGKVADFAPDVILLDVMMPGMDGPTTFSKLMKIPQASEIPVIFMTAKVQASEVDKYLESGAVGIITKPFDPMTISDQIREIVGR